MRLNTLILAALLWSMTAAATAFVSDELGLDQDRNAADALVQPFPALAADRTVGAISLIRQGVTGQVRVRAENCGQLMDVYGDGTWDVEGQDTAFYTVWLIARCKAIAFLAAQRNITKSAPPLDLSRNITQRLPAHFGPYQDCLTRTAQMRRALGGKMMQGELQGTSWQQTASDNALIAKFVDADGNRLEIEVLASFVEKGVGLPVWLLLVTQTEAQTGGTQMDVWPVTLARKSAQGGPSDDAPLTYVSEIALIKEALDICPAFLPILLEPDCPEPVGAEPEGEREMR